MKTCQRGHTYSRDNHRQCPACQAESQKRNYQKNRKERIRASIEYYQKHKDKKRESNKLYWARHPDKVEQHKQRFRAKNVLYSLWTGMNNRCYNPKDPEYMNYGGRGIAVCAEWRGRGAYARFVADLPPRPTKRHTLDRINNDVGYSKNNCKWATRQEQMGNRRTSALITIAGRTQSKSQWAIELGISATGFNNRIKRGWPEAKLLQKVDRKKQPQLKREILLERIAVDLYSAIGESVYEGKYEIESLMREVGLIPKEESSGTMPCTAS